MKNKRQFFSVSLYLDALKQLRVMGIVMLIFVGFVSISIALLEGDRYSLYALSLLSFLIFAPFMTLYIFSFLTSRKSSDVFHSIPYTRVSLFLSYISAVFTYVIAILIVNFFAYFIMGGKFEITVKYIISLIVCNLLVVSVITLAQGMTGTIFTNIAVTGIILFFPSLLINFVETFVCEFCPYISRGCIKFSFGKSSNIFTDMFIDRIIISSDVELEGIIYTFVLSIIYFVLAAILFNKRKSEMAGTPATNRFVQHIIRVVITLVICLLPLSDILYREYYSRIYEENYYYDIELDIAMLYFFAIFIYFLYELLSTKKLKNLVKIIPGIIVIAVLNVSIVFSVFGITEYVKKFSPNEEDVEYVIIHREDGTDYDKLTDRIYFMGFVKDGKITDKRIIKLICDQYDDVRKMSLKDYEYGGYQISFCIDGRIYDRYFDINEARFRLILKYIAEDEEILNAYRSLPEYDELERIRMGITGELYVEKDKKDIYEKYREDLSKISPEDLIKIINIEPEMDRGYIDICYYMGNEKTHLELPFIKELPTSYNKYLEIANRNTKKYMDNLVDDVELMLLNPYECYFAVIVTKQDVESDYVYLDYDDIVEYEDEFLDEKILNFCKEAADTYKLPDIEEAVFEISLGNRNILFSASDECMELFNELKKYQ